MIVIDANLLIYAYDRSTPQHARAKAWLEEVLSGSDPVGIPWPVISAFVRVTTHPKISAHPWPMERAVAVVESWLALPQVWALSPADRHWALLRHLLVAGQVRGALTSDAHLAAITMEHGGVLYTNDVDFARFPGLQWVNPLG